MKLIHTNADEPFVLCADTGCCFMAPPSCERNVESLEWNLAAVGGAKIRWWSRPINTHTHTATWARARVQKPNKQSRQDTKTAFTYELHRWRYAGSQVLLPTPTYHTHTPLSRECISSCFRCKHKWKCRCIDFSLLCVCAWNVDSCFVVYFTRLQRIERRQTISTNEYSKHEIQFSNCKLICFIKNRISISHHENDPFQKPVVVCVSRFFGCCVHDEWKTIECYSVVDNVWIENSARSAVSHETVIPKMVFNRAQRIWIKWKTTQNKWSIRAPNVAWNRSGACVIVESETVIYLAAVPRQ